MNITKLLAEYEIEYNVLQEEIATQNHHLDILNKTKDENNHLASQLQVAQTTIKQINDIRIAQEQKLSSLQAQVHNFGVSIETLGKFILELVVVDKKNDLIELPDEIKQILEQNSQNQKKDRIDGKGKETNFRLPLQVFDRGIGVGGGGGGISTTIKDTSSLIGFDLSNCNHFMDMDSGIGTPLTPDIRDFHPLEICEDDEESSD